MRLPTSFLIVAAATIPVAFSLSQDKPSQNPPPENPPPQTPRTESVAKPTANKSDSLLATWVLTASNGEVALAQLVEQRSQNPEVKQFAKKMVDDHRALSQKLQAFASPMAPGASDARLSGQTPPQDPAKGTPVDKRPTESGFATGAGVDAVALVQELGEQCLSSARRELEQKSGAELDRCYVDMMIGGHTKANDMLVVFQRHASGELKNVLAEGQKTVSAHLQHAKSLKTKIGGDVDADRPTSETKTDSGMK